MRVEPPLIVFDLGDAPRPDRPLLVLGPSLGTTGRSLWGPVARELAADFRVLGWDLPGHGDTEPATGFDIAALARAVLAGIDSLPSAADGRFHYGGDSIGGAVGLQLLLDAPARVASATLLCTGPKIGQAAEWRERAAAVAAGGTDVLLATAPDRWFAPGFTERAPDTARALLDCLRRTDAGSYAAACEALARFDVRDRLDVITAPVLAVAGAADVVTPTAGLRHIADGVQHGTLTVLDRVAHLAPVERPDVVASLIAEHTAVQAASTTTAQVRAAGMRARREVLGDAHVDRASAAATGFTADFQELLTMYAWGSIWTRPGLDRRSRSLVTLTAMVARGHHEELAMHIRAARSNGVTRDEIKELLLQTAVYSGVPDANTAFRIAQATFADLDASAGGGAPISEPRAR